MVPVLLIVQATQPAAALHAADDAQSDGIVSGPPRIAAARAAGDAAAWGIARLVMIHGGRRHERGLVLYSRDESEPGAAFRCDRGKLMVILAARPTDMREYLVDKPLRSAENLDVTITVGDEEPRQETWVAMYQRRLYMARRVSTTSRLFRAVVDGERLTLATPDDGAVALSLPPATPSLFETFLDDCELETRSDPYADAGPG